MLRSYALTLFSGVLVSMCIAGPATAGTINVPTVQVNALTHQFQPGMSFPFPEPGIARDSFSIGDGNYSGGEAFSISSIATGDVAHVRIQAPAGEQFAVLIAGAELHLNLYWQAGADTASLAGGTISFEGLSGTSPTETYSFLAVGSTGNVIYTSLQFTAAAPFAFTAIKVEIPVQSNPPAGARNFAAVASNSSEAFGAYVFTDTDTTVMEIQQVPEPAALAGAGASLVLLMQRRRAVSGRGRAGSGVLPREASRRHLYRLRAGGVSVAG
jgi:hypothetical protein